jgi:trans-aconitate methyltransferase
MPQVWNLVEQSTRETDETAKEQIRQLYSGVASLYHQFRPRYPDSLIDQAIELSPLLKQNSDAHILEIGCGPGTLTLPLAKRGWRITAIDPGSGMIQQARQVCSDYSNVEFQEMPLQKFETEQTFDAIIAASSLHWALAEDDRSGMIRKLHSLLKENGSLILLWNFPREPSDTILDAIADAIGESKPFNFGNGSLQDHKARLTEHVLAPLEESQHFAPFVTHECELNEAFPVLSFVSYLRTLSNYITMQPEEQKAFFTTVEKTLHRECGEFVKTSGKSILNFSTKI